MMSISSGLSFKKFDLHIHTPASDDYKEKNVTANEIVSAALSKDLSAIAITDHQSGAWIDQIKAAAKGKLTIFPGVELKVSGGKNGIHLVVLFDVDKNGEHVTQFLNSINVYKTGNNITTIADKTVPQVLKALFDFDETALVALAHCISSRGVLSDMNGDQRSHIFRPQHKCLLGAEAPESDFMNVQKAKEKKRVFDLLDGGYDGFYYKKMAVYQSSDAHSLSEIGSSYSYFKVDDEITIEDIRQCFIDRDTRIRQSFEYTKTEYPCIEILEITSGFLQGQKFEFHNGLNSILGAKGSGKSLAIELLRFALSQQPTVPELQNDHKTKLEKRLKLYGEIKVTYVDESGRKYLIRRIYNPADGSPIEVVDLSNNTKIDVEVSHLFPVLFLSQNEIIKVAEDRKNQREFIDKFFDFYNYQQEIASAQKTLSEIDKRFAEVLDSHMQEVKLIKSLTTTKEEIGKIDRQIKNTVFEQYTKKEKVGQTIKNLLEYVTALEQAISENEAEYNDLKLPVMNDADDPAVKRSYDIATSSLTQIQTNLRATREVIEAKKNVVQNEYDLWLKSFTPIKDEYDKVVKEAGGDQMKLDQKRKFFVMKHNELQINLTKCQTKSQLIKPITEKRNSAVIKLENAYKAYYEERKKRCEYFTLNSNGSLDVRIAEREDNTRFRENLMRFKKGSWLKDDEIEKISQNIDPKTFIDTILRYEWTGREKVGVLKDIATKTEIDLKSIERLSDHLLTDYTYSELLSLLYTSIPNDVPSIRYKVGNTFQSLDELSIGQKSVALLIIALSEGTFPIVIDQPEDSLDLRSIWDDLCKKLRNSKEKRQFIFTTHNSSVAVASDTDKFTILTATASNGTVLYSGSLNRKDIKSEVIDYLEGGKETYSKKRSKYDL